MNINKVDSVGKVFLPDGNNNAKRLAQNSRHDSVSLSPEAKIMYERMTEYNRMLQIVKEAPDVRQDRIAEVKAKMENNENYFSEANLDQLADRILKSIGV